MRTDTHYLPKPLNLPKATIHAFAEKIAVDLKFGSGDPIDPLVKRLGGRLEYRPAPRYGRLPESMIVENKNKFVIYVPSTTTVERDRFTIAHELGHLFLHYPQVRREHPGGIMAATRWVDDSDEVQQRAEWEANWFAAAFLMPSDEFRKIFLLKNRSLARTAATFVVSEPAAQVRAKTLGLL